MTLLEIVEKYPESEDIIRKYDSQVDACLLCEYLFSTINEIEKERTVSLMELLNQLKVMIGES